MGVNQSDQLIAFSIFGPPGSGKGTQATLIQERLAYKHASTGDMFRLALEKRDPNALKAQDYMNRGDLVPDEIIRNMLITSLERYLEESENIRGFILDGFPRTLSQAKLMDDLLAELSLQFPGVIYLDVSEKMVIERLKMRGTGNQQRPDDNEEVILERMRVYKEKTYPLVEYFELRKLLFSVDGEGTIEDIYQRLEPLIKSWE